MSWLTAEYFQAVKIRDDAISTGKELKRNSPMIKWERENYSFLDHMRRLEIIGDATGETKGILIEWEEVRIADICFQTMLRIQTTTDAMQKVLDGKIEFHHTCPGRGRDENMELLNEKRYGRLLINTEIYPCLKRATISREAIHLSRIGPMQIKGQERKKLIEAIAKSTGGEKSNYTTAG